jgi:hypothetical protein
MLDPRGPYYSILYAEVFKQRSIDKSVDNHYDAAAALRQKIGALAGRRETQARDVFDLHHLLAGGARLHATPGPGGDVVERANANALSVDFGTFKSQVLACLEPEAQAQYDSPSAWDTIVLEVVDAFRGVAS